MGETRREFIKNTALLAGGFILGQGAKANIANSQKVSATTQATPVATEQKTESEIQSALLAGGVMLGQAVSESQPQKEAWPKKEAKEIALLFPNATPLEKSEAAEMIDKQISYYKSQAGYEQQLSDTLSFKNIIAIAAQNLGIGTDSPLSELLLGMIFVESKGDHNAVASNASDAAGGLCQIKPSTALPIAKELNMKVPPDLFDSQTNIILSLAHLKRLFSLFPDYSLAVWAYHLGEGNMISAIRKYLVWEEGAKRQTIDDILGNPNYRSSHLVEDYKLNFVNLIRSEHVINELKDINAFYNDTNLYVPRVGAAISLLNG